MRLAFRLDSSFKIGTGHAARCLALAGALRRRGAEADFICRDLPGNVIGLIEADGFPVVRLPAVGEAARETALAIGDRPDWLVVDHYDLGAEWESAMRLHARRILAIDDLADRSHNCDALLDQDDLEGGASRRYDGLVPAGCRKLLGPAFALLRPEFSRARGRLRERDGRVRRILITFGGIDRGGETRKALDGVSALRRDGMGIDVVIGKNNPHRESLAARAGRITGCRLHCQIDCMAELMAEADLTIGAGGMNLWERCCLGLPSLVVPIAENQVGIVSRLRERGVLESLPADRELSAEDYRTAVQRMLDAPGLLREQARRASQLVDGEGARRVAEEVLRW